jgi:DNA-binding protein H-NS
MPTLEQIKDKMKKLQEQAEKLIAKRAQSVLNDIRKLMEEHGLTIADIDSHSTEKKNHGRPAGSKSAATTGKVASSTDVNEVSLAKYRHVKTGATWTGHGRAPGWIANVKDRTKFLIAGDAGAASAASVGTMSKAKTAVKKASKAVAGAGAHRGQRTGPQPAKYLDPKTGATWSGKGPAPAWLAAARDRSKFLIGGAGAVATETSTASNASKPKSSAASGAVEKKAATKKGLAKKAIAKKAARAGKAAPATTLASGTGFTT